jgi:hypothetical protein
LKRRLLAKVRPIDRVTREAYALAKTEFVGRIVGLALTERA